MLIRTEEYEISVNDTFAMLVMLLLHCISPLERKATFEAIAKAFRPVLGGNPDLAVEIAKAFFDALNENEIAHRVGKRYMESAVKHGIGKRR